MFDGDKDAFPHQCVLNKSFLHKTCLPWVFHYNDKNLAMCLFFSSKI